MKVGDKVKTTCDYMGAGLIPKGTIGSIFHIHLDDTYTLDFGEHHGRVDHIKEHHFENLNSTQSARLNQGKTQLREIDPEFITGLGEVLTASREKYDEGNWMKETKFSTPYESAMRHLMKFWDGQELDDGPDGTGKSHLLHAATNLMFLYYHTRSGVGIDDRLFKKKKEKDG